jgi:anthranilate 1,2-dioxygenase small subunit
MSTMTDSVYQMIVRAQAEYGRCIDDDRLEEWPDHFHGRCVYKITTSANHREGLEAAIIFANSRGMLLDRVSALRETPFLVARVVQDGDTDIFATGRYLDLYKLEDGQPKLNERTVVCDSSRIDTLLAIPL